MDSSKTSTIIGVSALVFLIFVLFYFNWIVGSIFLSFCVGFAVERMRLFG